MCLFSDFSSLLGPGLGIKSSPQRYISKLEGSIQNAFSFVECHCNLFNTVEHFFWKRCSGYLMAPLPHISPVCEGRRCSQSTVSPYSFWIAWSWFFSGHWWCFYNSQCFFFFPCVESIKLVLTVSPPQSCSHLQFFYLPCFMGLTLLMINHYL